MKVENSKNGKARKELINTIKNRNGITLIALIVTIVVLLILAGVTISAVFSDNGIIKKAQEAKNAWENATQSEINKIENLANELSNIEESINYYFDVVLDKTEVTSLPDTISITTKNYIGEEFSNRDIEYNIQINSEYEMTISDGETSRLLAGGSKNEETFEINIKEKENTNNFKIEIIFNVTKPYVQTIKKEIIYQKQIRLNYTGAEQIFEIQTPGNYRIELYGASGGNSYYPGNSSYEAVTQYGGKGGYSKGDIYLTDETVLYFYIGGAGGSYEENDTKTDEGGWNGGGTLHGGQSVYGAPGGRGD